MRIVVTTTVGVSARLFCAGLIQELTRRGHEVLVVSTADADLERLREEGVRVRELGMQRGVSPVRDVLGLASWVRLLRKARPDAVIAMTPKASLLSMVASRLVGVPTRAYLLVGLRLEGATGPSRGLLRLMERLTMLSATRIVANSPSLAARAGDLGLAGGRVIRHTRPGSDHGVDSSTFRRVRTAGDARRRMGLDPELPVIGFVGRLTADKGLDTLARSLGSLQPGRPHQLLVVGGPDSSETVDWTQRLRSAAYVPVTFTGHTDNVRDWIECMDVLVLPSLREGFPNVVLEAAAMEVPTVTTDATGARDSVVPGSTGLLVPVSDAPALAAALARLLDEPRMRGEMGSKARQWVEEAFDPASIIDQVIRLTTDDVAGPGR
jgi:glycosyltransferase involved in cell wall biosynthesis